LRPNAGFDLLFVIRGNTERLSCTTPRGDATRGPASAGGTEPEAGWWRKRERERGEVRMEETDGFGSFLLRRIEMGGIRLWEREEGGQDGEGGG
jgi:hypothetical protein